MVLLNYDLRLDKCYEDGAGELLLRRTEAALAFLRIAQQPHIKRAERYIEEGRRKSSTVQPPINVVYGELLNAEMFGTITGRDISTEGLEDKMDLVETSIPGNREEIESGDDLSVWCGLCELTLGHYLRTLARVTYLFSNNSNH